MSDSPGLKIGDLIQFTGEYHEVVGGSQLVWVISKLIREGLVIKVDNQRVCVLSEEKEWSIDFDSNCHIEIVSRTEGNNEGG
jgi:hypothetical protein